jgi:predicted ATPase
MHGRKIMKYKKHTAFMIDFISDFVNGEIERYFFNLDYSAYVIEHFPYMELEDSKLADRFAYIVDQTYERGTDLGLSDEEFRTKISNALDEWLGRK